MDEELEKDLINEIENQKHKKFFMSIPQEHYKILEQNAKKFKTTRTAILKFLIKNYLPYNEQEE